MTFSDSTVPSGQSWSVLLSGISSAYIPHQEEIARKELRKFSRIGKRKVESGGVCQLTVRATGEGQKA